MYWYFSSHLKALKPQKKLARFARQIQAVTQMRWKHR